MKYVVLDVAHREVLDAMNAKHLTLSVVPATTMVHKLKPTMQQLLDTERAIKVRDWVEVLHEYAPSTCSDGGVGTVITITKDDNRKAWLTVSYVLDCRIETRIEESRIHCDDDAIQRPHNNITRSSSTCSQLGQ